MDEKQFREISNKMDLIVRLLALDIVRNVKIQKEKIVALSSFGFGPSDIAKLLGTTPNTVSVALSETRKKTKKGEGQAMKETQTAGLPDTADKEASEDEKAEKVSG